MLRILDPAEADFPFQEPAMFHDLESGRDLYVDPAAVREEYLHRFAEHEAGLRSICSGLGIDLYR